MKCQCCGEQAKALVVWLSEPRADGSAAVKLLICTECSTQINSKEQRYAKASQDATDTWPSV